MTFQAQRPFRSALAAGLAAAGLAGCVTTGTPDEITVSRINVVDETGALRFILAGDAPGPMVRGERLERSIAPAALVFHDADGDESGGLALATMPDGSTGRFLTFDFVRQITDAVRLGTFEAPGGETWRGGLEIFDQNPYDPGPVTTSQGVQRVFLGTEDRDAFLIVHDAQGRERIRIGVDAQGEAVIEMLDTDGVQTFTAPQASGED